MISLFIKLLTGNVINILAEPDDTIKLLKFKIKLTINIPTYNQKLFFKETQLSDHLTIRDHKLQNNDTLHLYTVIRAGLL
jgi:hypothetical protein